MKVRKIDMSPFKLKDAKEDYPMRDNLIDILLFKVTLKEAHNRESIVKKVEECKGTLLLQQEEYETLIKAMDGFQVQGSARFMRTMTERVYGAELSKDR